MVIDMLVIACRCSIGLTWPRQFTDKWEVSWWRPLFSSAVEIAFPSVCLSVCLSLCVLHTLAVSGQKTLQDLFTLHEIWQRYAITYLLTYDRPGIWLCCEKSSVKIFATMFPRADCYVEGCMKKLQLWMCYFIVVITCFVINLWISKLHRAMIDSVTTD